MNIFLSLILSIFITTAAAASNYKTQCQQFAPPLSGGYCLNVPTSNASPDILYHLHGRGGSEHSWQDPWNYTEQIRDEWTRRKMNLPTVVSISFGPIWLLAEKNESPYSGLFEMVTQQIIPSIEKQLGSLKGKRVLIGESMGGFNTVQLALKTDLFQKAAVLCAPMSEVSAFAPKEEIIEHIKKSSAWQFYKDQNHETVLSAVDEMIQLSSNFFVNAENWLKADPLQLSKNIRGKKTEFYVTAGFYDRFALFEGNEIFAKTLKKKTTRTHWRPQWGGHCAMDIPSLASFLTK